MIFVGDDWSEDHHDVHVMDEAGTRLASRRVPEGLAGIGAFHELLARHADEPGAVVIGIETDRGLWVDALTAAGYQVYAVTLQVPEIMSVQVMRQVGIRGGCLRAGPVGGCQADRP
jgi:hypothetical protein